MQMLELIETLGTPLAFLTDRKMKIEGEIKSIPEDFTVEEIPVYLPCGTGDHLFLWIQKTDISPEFLQQHLSKQLGVHRDQIGMAGLKDRRAVTRQWISVPAKYEEKLEFVNTDKIQVLEAHKHTNKLKTGHLRGNRFTIVLKTETEMGLNIALCIRDEVLKLGIPNYFGDQRFGIDGETLQTGFDLLTGKLKPGQIPFQRRKFLTRLSLSAVQSALFNQILSQRIETQTAHTVFSGDVLQVAASGGPFVSNDPLADQLRFDSHEVITSGPIFGPKMKLPEGDQLTFELGFLERYQLTLEHFSKFKKLTSGTRRPLLLRLESLEIEPVEQGLKFQFDLPTGAYATVVLREFTKCA